jgi:tRNA A-37 threonylcarbamoyl transferase component Bud32
LLSLNSILAAVIAFVISLIFSLYLLDFIGYFSVSKKNKYNEDEILSLIVSQKSTFTSVKSYLANNLETFANISVHSSSFENEIVIGKFDTDGRVYSEFGDLPFQIMISKEEFKPRNRFEISIVILNNVVLVKKDFGSDNKSFINEVISILTIPFGINKPYLYSVDFRNNILFKKLILGDTLRNCIVKQGGKILNTDTEIEFSNTKLNNKERIDLVLSRGTEILNSFLDNNQFEKFETEIKMVHNAGITNLSLTFGNLVLEESTNELIMIDFESTKVHSKRSIIFHFLKDIDLKKYNRIFNRNLLTKESANELITIDAKKFSSFYASINFGNGFFIGPFWDKESGIGRWDYFNKHVLPQLIKDKRILDLGTNNSYLSLLLIKEGGAKSVDCVEMDPIFIERAQLVKRIFNWMDDQNYNLSINEGNMLEFLDGKFGFDYDIISFFCSIYYLDETQIVNLLTFASTKIPELIIQTNDGTRKTATENKSYKSSTRFLKEAIEKSNYTVIDIYYGNNFTRPIIHAKSNQFKN